MAALLCSKGRDSAPRQPFGRQIRWQVMFRRLYDWTLEMAGRAMEEALDEGEFTLQCGEQFATVTIYGRILVVYTRVELAGRCHPERN